MNKIFLFTDSFIEIENKRYDNLEIINCNFLNIQSLSNSEYKTADLSILTLKSLIMKKIDLGYDKFICIVTSKRLSGIYNLFKIAFENLNVEYEIIDSKTTGSQMILITHYGLELIKNGFSFNDTKIEIKKAIENSKMYFVSNNILSLKKSGRFFSISTIIDIFNKKHILTIDDGFINESLHSNGMKDAVKKIITIVENDLRTKSKFYLSITDMNGFFLSNIKKELYIEIEKAKFFREFSLFDSFNLKSENEIVSIAYLTDTISFS